MSFSPSAHRGSRSLAPSVLCAVVLATLGGCQGSPATGASAASPTPRSMRPSGSPHVARAPGKLDLDAVMQRAHFAYRAEGGGFTTRHRTYSVAVASDGGLSIAPRRPSVAPRRADRDSWVAWDDPVAAGAVEGAPLVLDRVALARSASPLPSAPTLEPDGSLRLERGAAVESVSNSTAGVAARFLLAAPPADGDLVVRLRASGERFVEETAAGVRFLDDGTGLGVRVEAAHFVDAAGNRTTVPIHFEDGEIRLAVSRSIVERATFPATLEPMIVPEIPSQGVLDGVGSSQTEVQIAYGVSNYLIVWTDGDWPNVRVMGARWTADGDALDPVGFVIGPLKSHSPVLAFNYESYLVAWEQPDGRLHGARVSPGGAVLAPGAFAITPSGHDNTPAGQASITFSSGAWTGAVNQSFLVAWTRLPNGPRSGSQVAATRVSKDGAVLDAAPIWLTSTRSQQQPSVAFDDRNYFVAWSDNRNEKKGSPNKDIYGTRVSPAGVVLDPAGVAISTAPGDQLAPAAVRGSWFHKAGSGVQRTFVAWRDQRDGKSLRYIYGARINAGATVLDPLGIAISRDGDAWQPHVARDHQNFMVLWEASASGAASGSGSIVAARVEKDAGTVLDPAGLDIDDGGSSNYSRPVAASDNDLFDPSYLAVYSCPEGALTKTCGQFFSGTGVPSGEL